jgi:hypothetical protein
MATEVEGHWTDTRKGICGKDRKNASGRAEVVAATDSRMDAERLRAEACQEDTDGSRGVQNDMDLRWQTKSEKKRKNQGDKKKTPTREPRVVATCNASKRARPERRQLTCNIHRLKKELGKKTQWRHKKAKGTRHSTGNLADKREREVGLRLRRRGADGNRQFKRHDRAELTLPWHATICGLVVICGGIGNENADLMWGREIETPRHRKPRCGN